MKPGTVNRELDTLKSILSKAVEWKYLVDSPARGVKRFRVRNRRTRILSEDEQVPLLDACERMPKLQALLKLALITGARIGELLALRWEDCQDGSLTFWDTKNGKVRRIPITDTIAALLASRPRIHAWVFTNAKTEKPYTTIRKVFERALDRAKIATGDVTVHTLRHTALSRMIEHGLDDYAVMSISGHSSTRMVERYTHTTLERRIRRWTRSTCPQNVHKTRFNKKRQPKLPLLLRIWWTAGGSNSRPPRCERGALPAELAAHCDVR